MRPLLSEAKSAFAPCVQPVDHVQGIFDQFEVELRNRQMRQKTVPIQPKSDDRGITGKEHDYEGGFVLITVQHIASSGLWHGHEL